MKTGTHSQLTTSHERKGRQSEQKAQENFLPAELCANK